MNFRNPLSVIILSLSIFTVMSSTMAQEIRPLKIGDAAPAMKYSKWLKGTPVNEFDPSQLYVLDSRPPGAGPVRWQCRISANCSRNIKGR